jgi:hypothetical protein
MHRFLARDTDNYSILIQPKWCIQDLNLSVDVVPTSDFES